MRGTDKRSGELFSYVDLEQRVRADHPLRAIREVVGTALAALSGDFAGSIRASGRPSIAPEMLLRAMLLQAFYSIRSERQLMERLQFDLLFKWFLNLNSSNSSAWTTGASGQKPGPPTTSHRRRQVLRADSGRSRPPGTASCLANSASTAACRRLGRGWGASSQSRGEGKDHSK